MSFDSKNKENESKYCYQWQSKSIDEHVCSSQLLSDSVYTLSEMASEELNTLETFSLAQIHVKCQQELELWHSSAVNHLQQIFSQRLNDLDQFYNKEIIPDLDKYKQKMIEQLKNRIIPKLNQILDEDEPDTEKAERIKVSIHRNYWIEYFSIE